MVPGEEEALAVEQRGAARRVAGDRDGEEVVRESNRFAAGELALDLAGVAGDVGGVEDALTTEAAVEQLVIGDVLAGGEEHLRYAAELFEPLAEPPRGARRGHEERAPAAARPIS